MEKKWRYLEIGPDIKPQAEYLWPNARCLTLDIDAEHRPDVIADAKMLPFADGVFDGILASHVLEHFPYFWAELVVKEWARALAHSGELNVIVPSLEWAARQILAESPSKATLPHLFGGQNTPYNVHLGGFTLRLLRVIFQRAGLAVDAARTGEYHIHVQGTHYEAEQHYVRGRRWDDDQLPAPRQQ